MATYRHHRADELANIVARLWDTTQHYRRAFTHAQPSANASGSSAPSTTCSSKPCATATNSPAERILQLHIRRTRVELSHHPEVFDLSRQRVTSAPAPPDIGRRPSDCAG